LGNEARCSRKITALWLEATTENIAEISDLEGYRSDFHNLFGFGFNGVDYKAEADRMVSVKSIN
jgi:enoyl-[acyl-carrier protein] reductase/trans-2-enoyl-CoA reductase (NAD+)